MLRLVLYTTRIAAALRFQSASMRKLLVVFGLFFCTGFGAQNKVAAELLVDEGVKLHDKGEFEQAMLKYDEALSLDKYNLLALAEKALTLIAIKKYEESINCCQVAILHHPGEKGLKNVYVTYGNANDALKKPEESLRIYEEGLANFPDYYQLYYNKGITLAHIQDYAAAVLCFEKAVKLNPAHASSHNAIARLLYSEEKNIPSLLAYSRFLAIEQVSERAKENLTSLQRIMGGNVERTGRNSVTVKVSPESLDKNDSTKKENDFATAELMLSMSAALDYDRQYRKNTEVENFIRKFTVICSLLEETKSGNSGFYWEYYAPYFSEMKDKKFVETFAYIALASKGERKVSKWIKKHQNEINQFFAWSEAYQWAAK